MLDLFKRKEESVDKVLVYCIGCKAKVENATPITYENKLTVKGVKRFLRTTCSKGHKVVNLVKKEVTQ